MRFIHIAPFVLLLACGGSTAETSDTPASSAGSEEPSAEASNEPVLGVVPNVKNPSPELYTGGQPEQADWSAVRDAGVRTVVNLRLAEELSYDERQVVEGLGMAYLNIPIAGAEDLTEDNARALDEALQAGEAPILVHCHSGNRVGALFGLRAGLIHGSDPDAMIEIARAHGLTREELEQVLRSKVEETGETP